MMDLTSHIMYVLNEKRVVTLLRVFVFLNSHLIHSYVQTIRYRKEEADTEEDGNTETKWVNVEKQTTPDRL